MFIKRLVQKEWNVIALRLKLFTCTMSLWCRNRVAGESSDFGEMLCVYYIEQGRTEKLKIGGGEAEWGGGINREL